MTGAVMPDWRKYVRERLRLPGLRAEREAEIVEDLAQHLEDLYLGALKRGASASEAEAEAQRDVQDWDALAREITRSDTRHRREIDQRLLDSLESGAGAPQGSPGTSTAVDTGRRSLASRTR